MNRRNPAPRRMVRCYGSRCGTRGSDYPRTASFLLRLFNAVGEVRKNRMGQKCDAPCG